MSASWPGSPGSGRTTYCSKAARTRFALSGADQLSEIVVRRNTPRAAVDTLGEQSAGNSVVVRGPSAGVSHLWQWPRHVVGIDVSRFQARELARVGSFRDFFPFSHKFLSARHPTKSIRQLAGVFEENAAFEAATYGSRAAHRSLLSNRQRTTKPSASGHRYTAHRAVVPQKSRSISLVHQRIVELIKACRLRSRAAGSRLGSDVGVSARERSFRGRACPATKPIAADRPPSAGSQSIATGVRRKSVSASLCHCSTAQERSLRNPISRADPNPYLAIRPSFRTYQLVIVLPQNYRVNHGHHSTQWDSVSTVTR